MSWVGTALVIVVVVMYFVGKVSTPEGNVVVKTYGSHDEMARSAEKMHAKGYRIEGQSGQFNTWRLFSGKHTVTVTWVRAGKL